MSFIVKFCVTRHQFHVFQTFLHVKAKKGFVASDFHLVQEPQIFNCFHSFLFQLIQLDSMYHFQVHKMTHMQL